MSYLPYLLAVWLVLVGLYGVVTSRHFVHLVLCVSIVQSGTYVLLLAIGYKRNGTSPVYADIPRTRRVVDPVVQSLTLTDVVVSVTLAALLLALAVQAHARTGKVDPSELTELRG